MSAYQKRWEDIAAGTVLTSITSRLREAGHCSVMLTGGRSAAQLYEACAASLVFHQLRNVHFYFGDERCVPPDHPESNYALVMRTLFKHGVPYNCKVIRMIADQLDCEAAAAAYAAQLPDRLDVLLLSMGEDGHIASLFPNSPALLETCRRVMPIRTAKSPMERLTITPPVIAQSSQIFVMALGSTKAAVFKRAQVRPQDITTLPARLVLSATWFLDM